MAVYTIADVGFEIQIKDPAVARAFAAYESAGETEALPICVAEEDLAYERQRQPKFSESALYSCALLRKISHRMLYQLDGLLLHAGALVYEGKAYLFVAPSGTGKTTHMLLWKKCLGDKVQILNGDKPFLRLQNGYIIVYGSPWQGKENFGMNAAFPLGGIYLLFRGQTNSVRDAALEDLLQYLIRATVYPEDPVGRCKVLDFIGMLYKSVPAGVLYCNMEEEACYTTLSHIKAHS